MTNHSESNGTQAHDERFSGIRSRMHKLIERASATSATAKPKMREAAANLTEVLKAHPVAAIAGAFVVGYALMRMVRRER